METGSKLEIIQNKKKKVLLVSFYFPPGNTIAAVRIGKFAKYLPEFGWEPIILTVNNISLSKTLPLEVAESSVVRTSYYTISDCLFRNLTHTQNSLPQHPNAIIKNNRLTWKTIISKMDQLGQPIYTLPVIEKLLFDPLGWYLPAVKAGLDIIRNNDISVILSSYGPSVSHFIAAKLHSQCKIPWVADYRDNWANIYSKHIQPFYYFDQLWEKNTVKNCSIMVSHSEPLADLLEKAHSKKTIVIPNGFDEEDFENSVPLTTKFTITYTGHIYPGKRDPAPLFQAIAEARTEGRISPGDIEMRFFGLNVDKNIPSSIKKYGVEDFVKLGGNIPYQESLKYQMESTILLLLSWNDPRDSGTVSGKIYEYLGAKRPVLALAYPGGEIDKLLQKSGCGIVKNDVSGIKSLLIQWLDEFKKTGDIITHYNRHPGIIKKYTRKEQSRALAEVFDNLST
jgi:glycosyltransferase involved in cell wall biosynthesis